MKKLRSGYTTGSCAAAASLGAALMLRDGQRVRAVELVLPAGIKAQFQLHGQEVSPNCCSCHVVKDAGDDPDVTHGIELHAELCWIEKEQEELLIQAGTGIGQVTKPGLAVAVGEPAINPVPRKMIIEAVRSVFPEIPATKTLRLTLAIPDGEQRAEQTLNRRLGIIGGLSLLGTTGVVKPISHKAWTDTLEVALDVALAAGVDRVVLCTGRTSEKAAREANPLPEEAFIMMGDHVGYTLEASHRKGVARIVLAAQFAKLVKIACGHEQTHVRNSSLDLKQLALWAREIGLDAAECQQLELVNTARQVFESVGPESALIEFVAGKALDLCQRKVPGSLLEILLVDYAGHPGRLFSQDRTNDRAYTADKN